MEQLTVNEFLAVAGEPEIREEIRKAKNGAWIYFLHLQYQLRKYAKENPDVVTDDMIYRQAFNYLLELYGEDQKELLKVVMRPLDTHIVEMYHCQFLRMDKNVQFEKFSELMNEHCSRNYATPNEGSGIRVVCFDSDGKSGGEAVFGGNSTVKGVGDHIHAAIALSRAQKRNIHATCKFQKYRLQASVQRQDNLFDILRTIVYVALKKFVWARNKEGKLVRLERLPEHEKMFIPKALQDVIDGVADHPVADVLVGSSVSTHGQNTKHFMKNRTSGGKVYCNAELIEILEDGLEKHAQYPLQENANIRKWLSKTKEITTALQGIKFNKIEKWSKKSKKKSVLNDLVEHADIKGTDLDSMPTVNASGHPIPEKLRRAMCMVKEGRNSEQLRAMIANLITSASSWKKVPQVEAQFILSGQYDKCNPRFYSFVRKLMTELSFEELHPEILPITEQEYMEAMNMDVEATKIGKILKFQTGDATPKTLFAFANTLCHWMNRGFNKKNTIVFRGVSDAGKSQIGKSFCIFCVGERYTSPTNDKRSSFKFDSCKDSCLCLAEEIDINDTNIEDIKMLFGGEAFNIDVKYNSGGYRMHNVPVMVTTNNVLWVNDASWRRPLQNRIIEFYFSKPILRKDQGKLQFPVTDNDWSEFLFYYYAPDKWNAHTCLQYWEKHPFNNLKANGGDATFNVLTQRAPEEEKEEYVKNLYQQRLEKRKSIFDKQKDQEICNVFSSEEEESSSDDSDDDESDETDDDNMRPSFVPDPKKSKITSYLQPCTLDPRTGVRTLPQSPRPLPSSASVTSDETSSDEDF